MQDVPVSLHGYAPGFYPDNRSLRGWPRKRSAYSTKCEHRAGKPQGFLHGNSDDYREFHPTIHEVKFVIRHIKAIAGLAFFLERRTIPAVGANAICHRFN